MKLITLSDHAGDQERLARAAREAAYQQACDAREAAIRAADELRGQYWAEFCSAADEWRAGLAVGSLLRWLKAVLMAEPAAPSMAAPTGQESIWASGQLGEQRVRDRAGRLLGDEWTALSGYLNHKGEMDLLLVGPTGIAAVEIKFLNGTVHARGGRWVRDKYDRWNHLVERGIPVRDLKGRAPSTQISETAQALEVFLASRGHAHPVRRAVVLAHDASRVGDVVDPGVDLIAALVSPGFDRSLLALLGVGAKEEEQAAIDVPAVVALVQRDHTFHAQRKAVPQRTPAGGAVQPGSGRRPDPAPRVAPALSPLQLRQVHALRQDIQMLHAAEGADPGLRAKVRQAVSGYWMSGSRWTVLSATSGGLQPGSERALLDDLLADCRQTFDWPDRTLHAIVVPVAVRLRSQGRAAHSVSAGAVEMLSLPSLRIAQILGAHKVAFGAHIYAAKTLYYADAARIQDQLLQIEAGVEAPTPALQPCQVHAGVDINWQMVYFLGVVVLEPGAALAIDSPAVQRALMPQRALGAEAFAASRTLLFNRDVITESVCEGFCSLNAGIRFGEDLQRRHLLEQFIGALGPHPAGVGLCYALAQRDNRVRLLVLGEQGAREFQWPLLAGESAAGFEAALGLAIKLHMPKSVRQDVVLLDLFDYMARLRDAGLTWLGSGT